MIRNIIWKGLESDTTEFCRISFGEQILVKSTIVGCSEGVPLKAEYEMVLSKDWIIATFSIQSCLGNAEQSLRLQHNGKGKWSTNGKVLQNLEGCMDIDISLTPFTNSLPINRLKPESGDPIDIDVMYIDVLHFGISRQRQHYVPLTEHTYRFSHDKDDFTADIWVDGGKLVTHYPGLFDRILITD